MEDNILTNTKIHITNKAESMLVQLWAFKLGYYWPMEGMKGIITTKENQPYLYFSRDGVITYGTTGRTFESHRYKRISMRTFDESLSPDNTKDYLEPTT